MLCINLVKAKRILSLLLLSVFVVGTVVLGRPAPAAAITPNCGSTAFLIDTTLPNGARWVMCWEERRNEGIVLHEAYFTPRNGVQRLVLYRASVSQIHVPYDNNGARLHDVSDYGLGGANLLDLTPAECPGGALLQNNGKDVICRTVSGDGYAYKAYGTQKQAYALSLFSVSGIGKYNYIPKWKFFDDGTIEPSMGAAGTLQFCTTDSRYGWHINAPGCVRGTSHTHNYFWRLDFDMGGEPNDEFQQIDFGGVGTSYRPITYGNTRTETARVVSQTGFRTWRILDRYLRNADGHPISYELDAESSHTFRGPSYEPWTRNDVYFTENRLVVNDTYCEQFVSHNPTRTGCADNLASFVNGQSVTDGVLWYGMSFHHLARDEDHPRMSTHWSSFRLIPRDVTANSIR